MPVPQQLTTVFLDVETTGLDPTRHKLWEVGMVIVEPDGEEHEHSWMWWPDLSTADPMALTVNHFYDRATDALPGPWAPDNDPEFAVRYEGDDGAPTWESFGCAAHNIAHYLDGSNMVGANPGFDASFLTVWLREWGHVFNPHYHLPDVESLMAGRLAYEMRGYGDSPNEEARERWAIARPPWKHTDLCRAVGVNPDDFDRHTALGDARMAKAAYEAVMG